MTSVRVPGDKSIAHRALVLAILAPGESTIAGLPEAADVRSTAGALRTLGATVDWPVGAVARVRPPESWPAGPALIDCGNSGTAARLLTGVLAGLGQPAVIDGDDSLRRRPMDRVVYPLQAMGARIRYREQPERLPVELEPRASGHLRVLRYRSRVASAQVKSALVFAALAAGVELDVWEPGRSRDHTERLLAHHGVPISFGPQGEGAHLLLSAAAREHLRPLTLSIPGDPSSAAFLLGGALLAGRRVTVEELLLNDTRTAYLEALERMGASLEISLAEDRAGEPVGSVSVEPGSLTAVRIEGAEVPRLVDEIPLISVLAMFGRGVSVISGAAELRVKESDRLASLAHNIEAVGGRVEQRHDGLVIEGDPEFRPTGEVAVRGDHRIAMAFGILNLVPGARVVIDDPGCVAVSYPSFWDDCVVLGGEEMAPCT